MRLSAGLLFTLLTESHFTLCLGAVLIITLLALNNSVNGEGGGSIKMVRMMWLALLSYGFSIMGMWKPLFVTGGLLIDPPQTVTLALNQT